MLCTRAIKIHYIKDWEKWLKSQSGSGGKNMDNHSTKFFCQYLSRSYHRWFNSSNHKSKSISGWDFKRRLQVLDNVIGYGDF